MKIAIDIREATTTRAGKGEYVYNIINNLFELAPTLDFVFYLQDKKNFPQEFRKKISQHHHFQIKEISSKGVIWHWKVAKDLKKEKVDIFFGPTSYITPFFIDNKRTKIIFTVHDLIAFLFPKNHNNKAKIIEKLFIKSAIKKATTILTVSESTKKDLEKKFPQSKNKIEVIYCAASKDFQPINDSSTEAQSPFFLSVGSLVPRKNHLNLIKAFANFSKKFPQYQLKISGGKAWNTQNLEQEVSKLGLEEKIIFLGYAEKNRLIELYNQAKAFVLPSFYEGFGIPVLEAMQSGCPVIVSKISSLPEVVGESGILVDPYDILEIEQAMEKIALDENLRNKLIKAGLKESQKFSWESSTKKIIEILKLI